MTKFNSHKIYKNILFQRGTLFEKSNLSHHSSPMITSDSLLAILSALTSAILTHTNINWLGQYNVKNLNSRIKLTTLKINYYNNQI